MARFPLTVSIGLFTLTVLLTASCQAMTPQTTVPSSTAVETTTLSPSAAAVFSLSNLTIRPTETLSGAPVTISAVVTNGGQLPGTHTLDLEIEGAVEATEEVTIGAGASQEVTFSVTKYAAKTYSIVLDGRSGAFTVKTRPTPTTTPAAPSPQTPPPTSVLPFDAVYTNPARYELERRVTITNVDAQVNVVRVWLPAISTWDSQTDVSSIDIAPKPGSTWKDSQTGNGVVFWEFRNEPGRGSSVTIMDRLSYTCYQTDYVVDAAKIGGYDRSSAEYQLYTRADKYIEVGDPRIGEIAGQLQQLNKNPYDLAGSIYDWVMGNLVYRDVDGLKGAKFAIDNGYGECGDYSALFTALCRACGIPARPIVGRWATSDLGEWHVWAEFYLPGYGWLPVDPTVADTNGKGRTYFGHLDNKRLILHKGFTMVLNPRPTFIGAEPGFLQTFVWEFQGTNGQFRADISYTGKPR